MKSKYYYNEKNQFVIEDYDKTKTFSSFLPGIAGVDGIPMWSFYVNRGQAMASFGVKDKDSSIMEFFPANTMYKNIELQGFRTFIKYNGNIHEIFSSYSSDKKNRKMLIEKNILSIEEINETLNIKVIVTYFTMPKEDFAAIVRRIRIENLNHESKEIEILDGITQILPFGVTNEEYKSISNVARAWFDVYNMDNKIAYYRLRASLGDKEEVSEIKKGNFYLSFSSRDDKLLPPIVDMNLIFENNTSLTFPDGFNKPIQDIYQQNQAITNKASGGFVGAKVVLNDQFEISTMIGHISDVKIINEKARQFNLTYFDKKEKEARELVDELVEMTNTKTANTIFDKYIDQCYLDNILRGGYPLIFDKTDKSKVYHVFSRKHGDLEREYNFFSVEPAYYSQGNGNYRDVNQNRRDDVFFNPCIKDFNVKQFMNLVQIDGYNPLHVKGSTFKLNDKDINEVLPLIETDKEEVKHLLKEGFTPGTLINYIVENKVKLGDSKENILEKIIGLSEQNFEAEFGEGYWIDHWTYNIDLIDSYLRIYPDTIEDFLFKDNTYRFFDSPMRIAKREEKYVVINDVVRQYGAIIEDKEKLKRLNMNKKETNWLKKQNGLGEIYQTSLYVKLVSLMLNKFVTLDPFGMGIEMEAGRPGWNDSMNGLPGLFGSGVSETAELKRLVEFLIEISEKFNHKLMIPVEIMELLKNTITVLDDFNKGKFKVYTYWDCITNLRENFRDKVRFGILGEEVEVDTKELLVGFRMFEQKIIKGLQRALEYGKGIYPTYIYYKAKKYEILEGTKNVIVTAFEPNILPFYLEGPTRVLKETKDIEKANELYLAVKNSGIYDQKLKMYKTSESIEAMSHEIGRSRAFTAGWLEREAIFMHMEYKYLLAVLKSGLYNQFFDDIRSALPPFMNPEVYGRSTLENSSFIASSMNPDINTHGRGFQARLTGAAAEMLSMWIYMMMGKKGFKYENGELNLYLEPILPAWFFDEKGLVRFKLFGKTIVTYHNKKMLNTYGEDGVKVVKIIVDKHNETIVINDTAIKGDLARMVRDGKINSIDVYLDLL